MRAPPRSTVLADERFTLEAGQFDKPHRAVETQGQPQGDLGATFFLQAVAGCVPQGQAHAAAPMAGGHIQGPEFAGGRGRALVARAVEGHKTHDLVVVGGHQHLGFTQVDGLAPGGLAAVDGDAVHGLGRARGGHRGLPGRRHGLRQSVWRRAGMRGGRGKWRGSRSVQQKAGTWDKKFTEKAGAAQGRWRAGKTNFGEGLSSLRPKGSRRPS